MNDFNINQKLMSSIMGVKQPTLSTYVNGRTIPGADIMAKVANEFKLNPYVLVKEKVPIKDFYLKEPNKKKYEKMNDKRAYTLSYGSNKVQTIQTKKAINK